MFKKETLLVGHDGGGHEGEIAGLGVKGGRGVGIQRVDPLQRRLAIGFSGKYIRHRLIKPRLIKPTA